LVTSANLLGLQLSEGRIAESETLQQGQMTMTNEKTHKVSARRKAANGAAVLEHPINMRSHARLLGRVERAHFNYFLKNQNPKTGFVLDRSAPTSPASIAAIGFSLTAYACAVKRGWVSRKEALAYTTKVLETLYTTPQGDEASGTSGYRGWYYHFLEPDTGLRSTSPRYWNSELSTIDTALLMAGVLFARNYFSGVSAGEVHVRDLATKLYERVEWDWMFREDKVVLHGWTPENGVIKHVYKGYSEAPLLYILALGSPTHPAPDGAWQAYLADTTVAHNYDLDYIKMPGEPLFCYQYPHAWIDFRGIADGVAMKAGFDFFENSRRMALVHYRYAQDNPKKFAGYGGFDWGLTACDGPGDGKKVVDGIDREFRGYSERGCPSGFDDGTIAPTAAVSSMPYVPEIAIPTIRYWLKNRPELFSDDGGFVDSFNPTFDRSKNSGWVGHDRIGIDQGPVVLMIENYRSGLIWSVMRKDRNLRTGLAKAGFRGGWLNN
jgi:hypothetical protein